MILKNIDYFVIDIFIKFIKFILLNMIDVELVCI